MIISIYRIKNSAFELSLCCTVIAISMAITNTKAHNSECCIRENYLILIPKCILQHQIGDNLETVDEKHVNWLKPWRIMRFSSQKFGNK